jgi:glutaredoxin 3
MLKEYLSQHSIKYQERDISLDRSAGAEVMRLTGQMAVPVTVIDGQTVIGFDRPALDRLLATAAAASGPSLGAAVGDAAKITRQRGLPPAAGAFIGSIRPGSLAQKLGLAVGDIITECNRQNIQGPNDLARVIAGLQSGSNISISFTRNGQVLHTSGTV